VATHPSDREYCRYSPRRETMGEHLSGIGENDCVVLFALRRRLAAINAILDTIVRSGADTALRNGRRWPPPGGFRSSISLWRSTPPRKSPGATPGSGTR
jgi:hypothetical protein